MSRPGKSVWGRLGGFLPKSRWLRLALVLVPVLVVMAVVEPVLGLLAMVVGALGAVLRPLLEAPYGRLALAVLATGATIWVGVHLWRARIAAFRAGLLLRRHLDGVAALLADDPRRSRRLLEGVARGRGPLPPEFPLLREDACLKLARLALRAGSPARAQAWLLRVPDATLSPSLARSWAQLRALVEIATPGALPASVERVVREALARFPDDPVLLRALRDLCVAQGAPAAAAAVQARVARTCADSGERTRLANLWLAAAEQAWAGADEPGATTHLAAAQAADPGLAAHSLLAGEMSLRRRDVRGALRHWARVPGARGLARCAELLAADAHGLTAREILELCPTRGGLLLAAGVYADRGDTARALRTARIAARALPDSPTAAAAIAEVRRRVGPPPS